MMVDYQILPMGHGKTLTINWKGRESWKVRDYCFFPAAFTCSK